MTCRCGHPAQAHVIDEDARLNGRRYRANCLATVVGKGYLYPCDCGEYVEDVN